MIDNPVLRKEIKALLLDFIIKYGEVFGNDGEVKVRDCLDFIEQWMNKNL
jgi:hypothetical protein